MNFKLKSSSPPEFHKKKRNPWIITLKVFCWCVGILIVLAAIALWIVSYHLSPERIARLIEEKSSEYLDGEIKIGKLDYKLFSTYPWLNFEIDSLTVLSKSLDHIPDSLRDSIPSDADFLASFSKLKGEVNVHGLLHDEIDLRGVEITSPKINIVIVNDTLNNFNIAPSLPSSKRVPDFHISKVDLINPLEFSLFSLKDNLEGNVVLNSLSLSDIIPPSGLNHQSFTIGFEGVVDGRYGDYKLPSSLPLKFNSDVHLALPSYSVKLNNLSLSLAGITLDAMGEIKAGSEGFDVGNAGFNVRVEDIFTLLKYLPEGLSDIIPIPEGLWGSLPLNFSISLISPYHFQPSDFNNITIENLPPFHASVSTENAFLSFDPPKGKRVTADDIYFDIVCDFFPDNPEETILKITDLKLRGEGVSLTGNFEADNLLGEQQEMSGSFNFQSPVMETLSYFIPNSGIKVAGLLKGEIDFNATAVNLGKDGFKDLKIEGDILSHSLKVNSGKQGNVRFKNLKSDYKARIPSYPLNNYAGTKIAFDFSADSILASSRDLNLSLSSVGMQLDAMDTVSGSPDPFGLFDLNIADINLKYSDNTFFASDIELRGKGKLNSSGQNSNYTVVSSTTPGDDAVIAARVPHSPLVLEYNGGSILQTAMTLLSLNANMNLDNARFTIPEYLYPINISRLELNTDLNNMDFSASQVEISNTSFSISGKVEGLGPFMTSYSATPLTINSDIDFNNVNINRLSWGYYGALIGKGISSDTVFYVQPMLPYTAADSLCIAIPRNIDANVKLRSKAAEYMQYAFSPLSTDIIVKDGVATLKELTVGAPYCTAVVDWTYSTKNLDNIFMDLKADVKNFSFEKFYITFPSLVEKSAELKDFTGILNAGVNCNFLMFPNMFMNSESLRGDFDIKGTELEFARKGKIEKITHLMLIHGDEPIHIQNINITGGFHDGVLQINPFKINFEEYQLSLGGVTNISGDIYYHFALEKSPFHLPFGVSLSGKLKHPEVRVGGTHINDYKTEMVTADPANNLDVNIMTYLKHGWTLFIQEAAKYEGGMNRVKNL